MSTSPPATAPRWRNRTYVLTFAAAVVPWLAFFGWVVWNNFAVTMDWVDRQNEFLQELLGGLLVLAWALFLGLGVGAAAMLADCAAGTRGLSANGSPGQTHGRHAAWRRPERS